LLAQPFGADRYRIRIAQWFAFGPVIGYVASYLLEPLRSPGRRIAHCVYEFLQRRLGVAVQGNLVGVIATQLVRVDVELDHRRTDLRDLPAVGHLPAGMAADE